MTTERQPRTWSGPNRTGQTQVNFIENIGRRVLRVSRVEQITPRYRRVFLSGADLDAGFPYVHLAPTDHVKVLFPQPSGEVVMPQRTKEGWVGPEGTSEPVFRDYTVRGWLPETRELIIDFVVHGHGVGSAWAAAARPGDQLGVMGPRGNIVFPENYSFYLLAGDESALPAMGRFVEELPEAAHARVVVEVADAGERQKLTERPGVEVTWVLRDHAGAGGLERAVRSILLPDGDDWFVFAAGEAGILKPIRDYFRRELGLPKERVVVDGYWKRGMANLDHHAIDLDAD